MVVRRCPHEVCNGALGQQLCPCIQGLQRQPRIVVLARGESQVPIRLSIIRFELHRGQKFFLLIYELLLPEQGLSQGVVQSSIVRLGGKQDSIGLLRLVILSRGYVEIGQIALQGSVRGSQLRPRLQFGNRLFVLSFRRQNSSQLHVRRGIIGMCCHHFPQRRFGLRKPPPAHVNIS